MAFMPCSIDDGCEKPTGVPGTARGLCSGHYQKWKRHGDPLADRRRPKATCSVDGCEKYVDAHSYCSAHYFHFKTKGTATPRMRGETVDGKRVCAKCRQDLPLGVFGRKATRPDGISSYCKPCQRAVAAAWRKRNPGYVQPRPPAEQLAAEAREYRRKYPERARETSRTNAARRRAAKYHPEAERFSYIEIYERDRWTCQICFDPIEQELRAPDPMSPSIDHLRPLARGGRHTRANCRATHLRCNLRKHAKVVAA